MKKKVFRKEKYMHQLQRKTRDKKPDMDKERVRSKIEEKENLIKF